MSYRTIVIDPPWRYRSGATKADVREHYQTLTYAQMAELPVEDLADPDGAHLWLWTTNMFLEPALGLVRGWGFTMMTMVTWCKPGPGVGYYLRNNTEHVIFATSGRPLVPTLKPLSTWYEWPRQAHSQKPEHFYDLVEQVSQPPYLEMFARRHRLGWDVHGSESANTVKLVG